jgi:clan AA aspartic protease (TIGR02281 family)
MFRYLFAAAMAAALAVGSAQAASTPPPAPAASIPMKKDGGVYVVPVSVNGVVTVDCIVDSGASDVNIPADAFRRLVRAGAVQQSDMVGVEEYTLADGSTERGRTFRIRSLKVGNIVVTNVLASIGGDDSSALLGQSFLERFRSWSLDNMRHALVLNGPPTGAPTQVVHGSGGRPPAAPTPVPHRGGNDNSGPATVAQVSGHRSRGDDDSDDEDLAAQTGH